MDVYFYEKGEGKSQVSIEHKKLPNREAAERLKLYWQEAFERLKARLAKAE